MFKKLGFLLIAIPTVMMLMTNWVSIGLVSFIADNAAIFWALGVSFLLYSVLSYFWIFVGVLLGLYLLIEYVMMNYLPVA